MDHVTIRVLYSDRNNVTNTIMSTMLVVHKRIRPLIHYGYSLDPEFEFEVYPNKDGFVLTVLTIISH